MATVYDVPAEDLIGNLVLKLKENENINPPEWAIFVKTGVSREMPPSQDDWWFTRCASILRRIYMDGPVGVSRLRSFYGGRNSKGVRDARFARGSGSIIRKAVQQLEKAGYLKKMKEGRVISAEGQSLLDKTAGEVKINTEKTISGLKKY